MDNTKYSLVNLVYSNGLSLAQFCRDMESRGEIVRRVVKESGFSVAGLARKINISRAQLYLDFENPQMSFDRVLAIGKVLHHDFSEEFKDIPGPLISLVNEEPASYAKALDDCRTHLVDVQSQLINALNTLDTYKRRYGPLDSA